MEQITIKKGMHLYDNRDDANYRVLHVEEDHIVVINLDARFRLDVRTVDTAEALKLLRENTLDVIEEEPPILFDLESLDKDAKVRYERNKLMVEIINKLYAPDYLGLIGRHKKPIVNELIEKSGLTRKNAWRIIIKYL